MKSINPLLSIAAATMLGSVFSSSAALVPIAGVTGHNGGQGHGEENGTLGEMIDQSGMDTTTNGTPDDPASWLTPTNSWPDEWQSSALLDNEISANGKIGWAAVDLGSEVADLDNLFIWHNRENNQRFAASYNIYYATSPDAALPADPGSENSNGDYDFASGGWTQLGDLRTGTHQGNETVALDGITARYFAFEIITNNGHLDRVGFAEIAVTSGSVDTTPPTLASDDIVDDRGGASVSIYTPVTYTLSFSENIDEATVTDADFSNAGTSIITIGTITETTPGIFTVEVTATTEGTLQLQIPTGAVISDGSGINLDTSAAIVDDTTITVAVDLGAPTLSPDNIVDDQGGLAVQVNDLVIYTLAFSEDMDDSTVGPDDFANAGTASITIGAINETAPGVFSVSVAPITIGTLQLQIPSEAVLTDTAGNPLDTTSSIDDDTLIAVEEPTAGSGIIPITSVTGHNGGQGFGSPTGELITMIDGSGMDKVTNGTPNDPASWLATGNAWQDEWQSTTLLDNTIPTANAKIGWTAIDLGSSVTDLENLYIWHIRENNERYAASYNVYYATSPTVDLPATPGEEQPSENVGAAGGEGDYDFASGGWTQLGGTRSGTFQGFETINLGGITAHYLALEILNNNGHVDRVGFAELAVTGGSPGGGGPSFGEWIAGFPGVGEQNGFSDDPDGDGIGNGLENFFGTAPDAYSEGILPGGKNGNTFTFTHPQNALPASDISAAYQWSVDLENFFADGATDGGVQVSFEATPNTPEEGTTTLTATITGPAPDRLFVEVVVSQ